MKNLDSIIPISDEGLYPIRTVSDVSGVNSITLRAWERRYGLFKPKRSPKGHRLYSDKDIQRIHEVLALLAKGVSIGRVAKALKENTNEYSTSSLLDETVEVPLIPLLSKKEWTEHKREILKVISKYDTLKLESLHHDLLSKYSIEAISKNIIIPLLSLLEDNSKQLASLSSEYSFYRTFILYRIGGLCLKTAIQNKSKKILLMGLTDEHCDVELLLFSMPLLQRGYQVITLGCNISLDAIPMSLLASKAEAILICSDINKSDDEIAKSLNVIVNNIDQPIFITDQNSKTQSKNLRASGVIVLPSESDKQIKMIEKNINNS